MYRQWQYLSHLHRLCDIHSQNVYDLDFDLPNGPRSNVNTPIESQLATSYTLAIVIITLSVTVYEITTFNPPKWS